MNGQTQQQNGRQTVMPQVQGQLAPMQQAQLPTVPIQMDQFLSAGQVVPAMQCVAAMENQVMQHIEQMAANGTGCEYYFEIEFIEEK